MNNKRNLIFLFVCALLCAFTQGCSKNEDDEIIKEPVAEKEKETPAKEDSRYYVKYEIMAWTERGDATISLSYKTDMGEKSETIPVTNLIYNNSSNYIWEGTYGPVSKYFVTKLGCTLHTIGKYKDVRGRIYVSIDNEPFVIKEELSSQSSILLNYIIDF